MKNISTTYIDTMISKYPSATTQFLAFYKDYINGPDADEFAMVFSRPFFHELPFLFQVGVIMDWVKSLTPPGSRIYGAAFILSDDLNIAGIERNLSRILSRIERNLTFK